MLKKLWFCDQWVKKIMKCVSSVQYSVIFNGRSMEKFVRGRRIRKGDPLSPFLFIMVADVLSKLIKRSIACANMKGLRIKTTYLIFSNLFLLMMPYILVKQVKEIARHCYTILTGIARPHES